MVLFVSDIHFGRGGESTEREKERALLRFLQSQSDDVEHLYLLGDVFDGFIEYRHLVPKGQIRFQGLLADWADRGIPVTYLFGNHDPWHDDYFSREVGVETVEDSVEASHDGCTLHLAHGDSHASTHRSFSWLRPIMRHSLALRLYRSLLPADVGLGLAKRLSRALYDPTPDPKVVRALRKEARRRLRETAVDSVLMGHSHEPAFHRWDEGVYVNTGNWYEKRTFARLDERQISLCQWNGTSVLDIESAEL